MMFKNLRPEELFPITLTRDACDIFVGGFTLRGFLKRLVPEFSEEIDANVVPSVKNIELIKKGELSNLDKINYPHEIVIWNKRILNDNLEFLKEGKEEIKPNVFVGENVEISDNVIFDSKDGIIVIDDDVKIMPFTLIQGPVFLGEKTLVKDHSAIKKYSCISKICKVAGEIEGTIFHEFSNKAHFGFLGDSVIGSWVNFGAGTSNSNLKNTYGKISVKNGLGEDVKTDEIFLGCVIGDYSKFAINSTIFTGKIIGVNSIIYGKVIENIPSFVNYTKDLGKENNEFDLEKSLEIQKIIFERRDKKPSKEDIFELKNAFKLSQKERDNFLK